jgi:xylulokinase
MSVRHVLSVAEAATGVTATEVRVAGAAGRSEFWNRLKADVLGRPVREPAVTEGGVVGAAILAAVGAGCFADIAEAAARMVRVSSTYAPRGSGERYDRLFAMYRDLATDLAPAFARLHAWGQEKRCRKNR